MKLKWKCLKYQAKLKIQSFFISTNLRWAARIYIIIWCHVCFFYWNYVYTRVEKYSERKKITIIIFFYSFIIMFQVNKNWLSIVYITHSLVNIITIYYGKLRTLYDQWLRLYSKFHTYSKTVNRKIKSHWKELISKVPQSLSAFSVDR